MNKWIAALAAIIFLVAIIVIYRFATGFGGDAPRVAEVSTNGSHAAGITFSNFETQTHSSTRTSSESGTQSTGTTLGKGTISEPATSAVTAAPIFTNLPPDAVMDAMRNVIHNYASMFGGNPVGNNAEITAALNAGNPKQANFIKPEAGMRLNGNGELIDPWGTPYFFHQMSATEMEIHSAGPDRVMWTPDDLVTK